MSVAVVMGSASDAPVMEGTVEVLRDFDVPYEVRVLSAHRTPDDALDFARKAAGWKPVATLRHPDDTGSTVAVAGSTAIVGVVGTTQRGHVYVYQA